MSSFGNAIMGFFGGASSGGGGGTSTGVNGLNGTTNIGLGGTLTGDTQILGGGYDLFLGNDNPIDRIDYLKFRSNILDIENFNTNSTSKIFADSNNLYLQFFENVNGYASSIFINQSEIRTANANGNVGLQLNLLNNVFILGDYEDTFNRTKLIVDDLNGWVYTNFFATSQCGIFLTEGNATFSAFDGTNKISLNIAGATKEFNATYGGNIVNGLSLNFDTFVYKFGGFDIASNGTLFQINDTTFTTSLNTEILELSGSIIDNNAPQNIGVKYLVVTLSGVEYSILCTETNL